jgi:Asp-tRNA(Asn)/Glu-tRNA(Gln) amidotransferase A subunit family amidase
MRVERAPLSEAITALRGGSTETTAYVTERYRRVDAVESDVRAWVGGPKGRDWLTAEAAALAERHPDVNDRPPLYGVPVGVKDVFHVDGLPTRAGSELPPGELAGSEAAVVMALRRAGAIVMGKTVTTEFAYFEPGPTRNPHDLAHTPGGSSSGSAAAVAAGMCPLALGTQTIGSVVRPASFCGVVGFKPSYGRIPTDGVVPLSPSLDHVGLFTRDVAGMRLAADVCVDGWEPIDEPGDADDPSDADLPVLGVPDGAYLAQASDAGCDAFEGHLAALDAAGFEIRRVRVDAFERIDEINERHTDLMAAEAALAHRGSFAAYPDRYADSTAGLLREGREVSVGRVADARAGRIELRKSLAETATEHGIDVWISPGAPGPAPEGIDTTGDPVMNLPWTHAGVPAVAIPGGTVDGLPVGVQCTASFGDDERLLRWAASIVGAIEDGP